MFEKNIISTYIGPFDSEILVSIAESMRRLIWKDKDKGKRFLKVFIELTQNINQYSEEIQSGISKDGIGRGIITIATNEDYVIISTGNKIKPHEIALLNDKCEKINSLDRDGLRALKRELRQQQHQKDGGNIGLVKVALVSRNKLDFKILELSNNDTYPFYTVSAKIKK